MIITVAGVLSFPSLYDVPSLSTANPHHSFKRLRNHHVSPLFGAHTKDGLTSQ